MKVDEYVMPLLVSSSIISVYIAHTFVNIIPATFLGVPEEGVALTMLPAHSLLVKGRGYEAIYLSAMGSFFSAVVTILLMFSLKFLLSDPVNLYASLKDIMVWIIIAVISVMILTEKSPKAMLISSTILLLSGIYELIVLDLSLESPFGLPSSSLFPSFAGLFGLSTLLSSVLSKTRMVEQELHEPVLLKADRSSGIVSVVTGSFSGILVSIIPGVTTAIGTVIALVTRGETDERQAIITLSSVNTAVSIATIFNLFIIGKTRSGVAIVVRNLIGTETWKGILPPYSLLCLLIPVVVSASLSLPVTCCIGRFLSEKIGKINYQKITWVGISLVIILVFIFSGFAGLLILFTGASIGLLPIFVGVRRSSCMG
ncbi:MAG TPA: hypothetical protein ENL44_01735, partial [Thermoplasmatales archaeon]|nr:hypothetical protein [Thermoplasmatales archaeon]